MAQLRSGSGRTEGVAIWALVRHPLLCRVIRVTRSIARLRKVKLSAALGCNSLHVVFIWRRMVLRLRQACITRCLRSLTRTRPSLRRRLKFWSLPLPMRALHTMQHPHPALVSPERGTGLSGTHGSRPRRLARLTSTLDQRLATCSRDVHKRARHPSLYLSATIACTALLRWVSRVPFFVSCPNMAGGLPITVRVSSSEAVVPFFLPWSCYVARVGGSDPSTKRRWKRTCACSPRRPGTDTVAGRKIMPTDRCQRSCSPAAMSPPDHTQTELSMAPISISIRVCVSVRRAQGGGVTPRHTAPITSRIKHPLS